MEMRRLTGMCENPQASFHTFPQPLEKAQKRPSHIPTAPPVTKNLLKENESFLYQKLDWLNRSQQPLLSGNQFHIDFQANSSYNSSKLAIHGFSSLLQICVGSNWE